MKRLRCEFHSHSSLSDGDLLPIDLIKRADACGHKAIAITDHVSMSNVRKVVSDLIKNCKLTDELDIIAIPGVEITDVPPKYIAKVAKIARKAGAQIVVVHGETLVESVLPGTNLAAVSCTDVDILGHPGLIDERVAKLAHSHDIFLEICRGDGHSLTNGYVGYIATRFGAMPIVNTDAHKEQDLISQELAIAIAKGANLDSRGIDYATRHSQTKLLKRVGAM
jgi:histidinol phosphatase-like PHP family hydrolase